MRLLNAVEAYNVPSGRSVLVDGEACRRPEGDRTSPHQG
jgi:hypothetical protein